MYIQRARERERERERCGGAGLGACCSDSGVCPSVSARWATEASVGCSAARGSFASSLRPEPEAATCSTVQLRAGASRLRFPPYEVLRCACAVIPKCLIMLFIMATYYYYYYYY